MELLKRLYFMLSGNEFVFYFQLRWDSCAFEASVGDNSIKIFSLLFCNDPRANWVSDGLANGFEVDFSGGQLTTANQNMYSACFHPEIVDDYLLKN